MLELKEKAVLITGATGRLGSAFSHRIVEAGGRVFLVDLNQRKGEELSQMLGKENAPFLAADITNLNGMKEGIAACVSNFGKMDAVIHAAYRAELAVKSLKLQDPPISQRRGQKSHPVAKQLGGNAVVPKEEVRGAARVGP